MLKSKKVLNQNIQSRIFLSGKKIIVMFAAIGLLSTVTVNAQSSSTNATAPATSTVITATADDAFAPAATPGEDTRTKKEIRKEAKASKENCKTDEAKAKSCAPGSAKGKSCCAHKNKTEAAVEKKEPVVQ